MKINRLIKYLAEIHGVDVDFIIFKNPQYLKYMVAEIYYPPPEGIAVHRIGVDVQSGFIDIYVSPLEYFRVRELYEDKDVNIYAVIQSCADLPQDMNCVEKELLDSKIFNKLSQYKRIAVDDTSICEDMICIDVRKSIRIMRRSKMSEEIEIIKKAIEISESTIHNIASYISHGVNEIMIASIVESEARKLGAEGFAFTPIVAIGKNTAKPHHIPSREVFSGVEPILIDFGVRISGYVCDITRIVIPKKIDDRYKKMLEVIENLVEYAVNLMSDGVECSKVDEEVRNILKRDNLHKYFIHGLGHGIGIDVHEEPRIVKNSKDMFIEGDVVTVEPGIYIYGKYGIRLEDNVAITGKEAKFLTKGKRVIEIP